MTGVRAAIDKTKVKVNAQDNRTETPAPPAPPPSPPPIIPSPPIPPTPPISPPPPTPPLRNHDARIGNATTLRKTTFVQTILRPLRALRTGNMSQHPSDEGEIELNTPHSTDESDGRDADRQTTPSTVPRNLFSLRERASRARQSMRQNHLARSETRIEEETTKSVLTYLFENLVTRSPWEITYGLLFTPAHQSYLRDHITNSTSTTADLAAWLRHVHGHEQGQSSLTPLDLLFNIIKSDTIESLKLIDSALSEINHHMLDDAKLEENLPNWRAMIDRFGSELRQTCQSLITFADFLSQATLTSEAATPEAASASTDFLRKDTKLPNVLLRIAVLEKRTLTTYKLLTANVSIVESKRGIAEAESVSRLTELAFLFIPLTFSASIFSMQVKELSGDNISIYAFFILGLILVCILYGIRLLIRSGFVIKTKKLLIDQVRTSNSIPLGAPIPARALLFWMWHRFWLVSVLGALLVAAIAVSLIELWARAINIEFKVILSFLILLNTVVAIRIIARTIYLSIEEHLQFQQEVLKSQEVEEMKIGWFVLLTLLRDMPDQVFRPKFNRLTVIIDLIMVPVIAMWARPLAISIKIVITLCMIFVLVATLAIYGVQEVS